MCILKSIHYIIVATNIYITIYLHFYNNNISYVTEIGYHNNYSYYYIYYNLHTYSITWTKFVSKRYGYLWLFKILADS